MLIQQEVIRLLLGLVFFSAIILVLVGAVFAALGILFIQAFKETIRDKEKEKENEI